MSGLSCKRVFVRPRGGCFLNFSWMVSLWLCSSLYAECNPVRTMLQEPILHFDASVSDSFQLGANRSVQSWESLNGRASLVRSEVGVDGPVFEPAVLNGLSAVRFSDGDSSLFLKAENLPELKMGSIHLFVVARQTTSKGRQGLLSMGNEDPSLSLFSDGENYRLRTGDSGNQNPEGPPVDGAAHLFSFSHLIDNKLDKELSRSFWPGDFKVDGALCGKVFNPVGVLSVEELLIGGAGDGDIFHGDVAEILIFNRPLEADVVRGIQCRLAEKWGLPLTEWKIPEGLPLLKEVRIGPAGRHSSFGYFGESPESPDGRRIAYVVFQNLDGSDASEMPIDLWVCDHDFSNHRLVMEGASVSGFHNGAVVHWVDNHRVVAGAGRYGEIKIINVDTGAVDFGPYAPGWPGGIGYKGQVLLHMTRNNPLGPVGIYQLNTTDGEIARLFSADEFTDFYDEYAWRGRRNPNEWRFVHGKFSEQGTHIGFSVVPRGGKQYLFTARSDGADLRVWGQFSPGRGSDKPLHWQWYDDDHIFGVDQETSDRTPGNLFIKLWDREGRTIRTLAGPGNHIAMSYDKNWFAGDSFYFEDPVRLYLYQSGQTVPSAVIFEHDGIVPTWVLSGHINPSFSRDGRRLYYSRPVGNKLVQAYCVDLTPVIDRAR